MDTGQVEWVRVPILLVKVTVRVIKSISVDGPFASNFNIVLMMVASMRGMVVQVQNKLQF